MKNRGHQVLAVDILFLILTWLVVSLRIYVRVFMLKAWGWDDRTLLATQLVFTVYLVFQMVAATYGIGRHRWELEDKDARIGLMFAYLTEVLYVVVSCLLKYSLGLFYLRIAIKPWQIRIVKLLMIGTVTFGGGYFFVVTLQCIPVSEFWNNHPASDKCVPKVATIDLSYAMAGVNAAADWSLGVLPLFIVWDLQMTTKTKILVSAILAFAAIGSTATLVRMKYIHSLIEGEDFLYAGTDVALWSTVEPGIGITALSLVTLRPLYRVFKFRIGLAASSSEDSTFRRYYSPSTQKRRHQHNVHRSPSILGLVPTSEGTTSTEVSAPKRPTKSRTKSGSRHTDISADEYTEQLVGSCPSQGNFGGIVRDVIVEHEYADGRPRRDPMQ